MNNDMQENLSAYLDDELGYHESLGVMSRVQADPQVAAKLYRYAVARELMRSSSALVPDAGFADRVQAALADEPVVLAPRSWRSRYREKVTTLALAASVAALALLVGRSISQHAPWLGGEMLAQAPLSAPVVRAGVDPDLQGFVALHNESTYLSGAQGMLPSVRLVSGQSGH